MLRPKPRHKRRV